MFVLDSGFKVLHFNLLDAVMLAGPSLRNPKTDGLLIEGSTYAMALAQWL